jgi:regulator of replication initiation timing
MKHVCDAAGMKSPTKTIDATVLIDELKRSYKKDNDAIYSLYDIVSKENIALKDEISVIEQKFEKLKQENSELFDENTRLMLEINQRKDNLQVDDDDTLKKKMTEVNLLPTVLPAQPLAKAPIKDVKKSNTLKKTNVPKK